MRRGGTKVADLICVHLSDSEHAFVDPDITDFIMSMWSLRSKPKVLE